jgi:hypothetical protein
MHNKLSRILLGLALISILSLKILPANADGSGPSQSSLSQGLFNTADGYTVYLPIGGNPGVLTTNNGGTVASTNPLAFTASQFSNTNVSSLITYGLVSGLTSNLASFSANAISSCAFYVDDGTVPDQTSSQGSDLFSLTGNFIWDFGFNPLPILSVGNHSISTKCYLSPYSYIGDYNNIYIVDPSSSPAPKPETFQYTYITQSNISESTVQSVISSVPNSADGYTVNLIMDANPGVVSSTYKAAGLAPDYSISINPFAYSNSELAASTIVAEITTPSPAQSLANLLAHGLGGVSISSCSLNVTNLDTNKAVSADGENFSGSEVSGLHYVNLGLISGNEATQPINSPQASLATGNYQFNFSCSLSDGNSIDDYDYVYVPTVPGPEHSVCNNLDACVSVAGAGTNQCNTDADCQCAPPTVSVTANPTVASSCQPSSTTVSWAPTNATVCADGNGNSYNINGGSQVYTAPSPSTQTYSITCANSCGSDTGSAVFTVTQPATSTTQNQSSPSVDIKAQ